MKYTTATKIVVDVYETEDDDYAALVAYYGFGGNLLGHDKTRHDSRSEGRVAAFERAFEGRDVKHWNQATYRSEPGRVDYARIA